MLTNVTSLKENVYHPMTVHVKNANIDRCIGRSLIYKHSTCVQTALHSPAMTSVLHRARLTHRWGERPKDQSDSCLRVAHSSCNANQP